MVKQLPADDFKRGQYVTVLTSTIRKIKVNDNESLLFSYYGGMGIPHKIINVDLPYLLLEIQTEEGTEIIPFDIRHGQLKRIKKSYYDQYYAAVSRKSIGNKHSPKAPSSGPEEAL